MADTGALIDDPMDGITTRTKKEDLLERIKKLGDVLHGLRSERLTEIQQLEQRIRAKYKPNQFPQLKRVILASTEAELDEAYEFLKDFEELMPPALQRFHAGLAMLLSKADADFLNEDDAGEFPATDSAAS